MPTNPPVPATPLDVEACVRLLTRVAFLIERVGFDLDIAEMVGQEPEEENPPEDINLVEAEQQEQADGLRALASALPGMGKAMEENESLRRDAERWRSRRKRPCLGTNGRMCLLEPGHDGPHKPPPVEPDTGSDL